uniref:Lipase domain-containing protein n=1 Tax=Heterorhabditis bacteriophora TaxID=37862 RepID=A0A1I7WIP2_HETBA
MSLLLCRVSSMAYVGKYAGPNSTPENSSRILEDYLSNRTVNRCLDNWNKYLWGAIVILFLINAIFLIAGKLGTTSKVLICCCFKNIDDLSIFEYHYVYYSLDCNKVQTRICKFERFCYTTSNEKIKQWNLLALITKHLTRKPSTSVQFDIGFEDFLANQISLPPTITFSGISITSCKRRHSTTKELLKTPSKNSSVPGRQNSIYYFSQLQPGSVVVVVHNISHAKGVFQLGLPWEGVIAYFQATWFWEPVLMLVHTSRGFQKWTTSQWTMSQCGVVTFLAANNLDFIFKFDWDIKKIFLLFYFLFVTLLYLLIIHVKLIHASKIIRILQVFCYLFNKRSIDCFIFIVIREVFTIFDCICFIIVFHDSKIIIIFYIFILLYLIRIFKQTSFHFVSHWRPSLGRTSRLACSVSITNLYSFVFWLHYCEYILSLCKRTKLKVYYYLIYLVGNDYLYFHFLKLQKSLKFSLHLFFKYSGKLNGITSIFAYSYIQSFSLINFSLYTHTIILDVILILLFMDHSPQYYRANTLAVILICKVINNCLFFKLYAQYHFQTKFFICRYTYIMSFTNGY